jgi:hypothetical protein
MIQDPQIINYLGIFLFKPQVNCLTNNGDIDFAVKQ